MAQVLYAFSGIVGSIYCPGVNPPTFPITGDNSGISKLSWTMDADVTAQERAADGTIITSAINAGNGTVSVEVFQNSSIDLFLMNWYNTLNANKIAHNLLNWNTSLISLYDTAVFKYFTFTALSPKKYPDRSYGVQAVTVTWEMMAGSITQE